MAAAVDPTSISQVLAVVPDLSGFAWIAATVASILANVDIIRLAILVGRVQEIAWTALGRLLPPSGRVPDPVGAGAVMTGLVPVGLDLASVAVRMLSARSPRLRPCSWKADPDRRHPRFTSDAGPDLLALAG
ncbi:MULTISPECIES: hypothetical protein [unclassified Rhodococcus (in: high G+C Gram-positive bacteria)]|uniref:hypothetical protein n=1 Tax=unclassified Rhodococcus (in: high G+C Gram-positive bacteria) TaxID=192944 RepID=UPI00092B66B7|nr:hypothetical protein [Rhodococcus sp. M8]OLL19209.1 hypothetical protein BKE56_003890 [Rhodococcus sp. M8]QPG47898.1 hypothetical protein ISO16_13495 [Rhodococcus sp. M8]